MRQFDLEWASDEAEWKTDAAWLWVQSGLIVRFKQREQKTRETEDVVQPAVESIKL